LNLVKTQRPPKEEIEMTATMHHHLTAHWVDEDEGAVGIHHHLAEVWVDEEESTPTRPEDLDVAHEATS
jgi:hypothetical protein